MSVRHFIQEFSQFWSVDEIAIVSKADSVGTVDVERLSLSTRACKKKSISNVICVWDSSPLLLIAKMMGWSERTCAGSRVPEVANSHKTWQIENALAILEDVSSHAIAFALVTVGIY